MAADPAVTLRLALAQINVTVGDLAGNRDAVAAALAEARGAGAGVVVFPELVVTGYPPEDLLLQHGFVRAAMRVVEELAPATAGLTAVLGTPWLQRGLYDAAVVLHDGRLAGVYLKQLLPNYGVFDEQRYFRAGRQRLVFERSGARLGISICEDIWYPDGPPQAQACEGGAQVLVNLSASPYHRGKGQERERMLGTRAADALAFVAYCNLVGGQDELVFDGHSLVCAPDGEVVARARQFEEELLVVDLDVREAIWRRDRRPAWPAGDADGDGFQVVQLPDPAAQQPCAPDPEAPPGARPVGAPLAAPPALPGARPVGAPLAAPPALPVSRPAGAPLAAPPALPVSRPAGAPLAAPPALPGARPVGAPLAAPPAPSGPAAPAEPLEPAAEVYSALVLGTRDYVRKNGFQRVLLGLSGGIDSSLVAAVAVDALGQQRVTGVSMPTRYSSAEGVEDARRLAAGLGIRLLEVPIDGVFQSFLDLLSGSAGEPPWGVMEENLQARIRGMVLMALSNRFGWLVLTTGDKSEVSVGYMTLYGDMAGGFDVLKDVPKTLCYVLARYRNRQAGRDLVPERVLQKPPSPELKADQKASDTLPDYAVLDPVLNAYVEEGRSAAEIVSRGLDPDLVRRVVHLADRAEYKRRQAPPGVKITPRAFGRDRRMPITNRFDAAEEEPPGPER